MIHTSKTIFLHTLFHVRTTALTWSRINELIGSARDPKHNQNRTIQLRIIPHFFEHRALGMDGSIVISASTNTRSNPIGCHLQHLSSLQNHRNVHMTQPRRHPKRFERSIIMEQLCYELFVNSHSNDWATTI